MAKQSVKSALKLASRTAAFETTEKSNGNSKLKYHRPGSQNRKK